MTQRARVVVIAVLAVVLIVATTFYITRSRSAIGEQSATATAQTTRPVTGVESGPRIIFRNTALGPSYGRVAMVPLADPGGARAITSLECDRVFSDGTKTLCLASDRGVLTTYSAKVYPAAGGTPTDIPLTGSPSRARLSGDGSLSATTSFVSGDSYAQVGFSTRTVVTHLTTGATQDLETFTLIDDGRRISPTDRNYWGVTFAKDDDSFFVTVAFGGKTHLAQGKLSTKTVETIRTAAECPSLSPDQTRVAYKKRGDRAAGDWRLAVLELATGKETVLSETRSVDDQVEWLDNERILYGLPGEGSAAPQSNVWVANADGTEKPSLLVADAWSPAVIR